MGFTGDDDLTTKVIIEGRYVRRDNFKTMGTFTAGGWHLFTGLAGNPPVGTFPGTDLVWASCNETSGDGTSVIGIQNGGVVGPSATKHLLSIGASIVAAAGAPWQLKLVDLQGYYRLSTTNVTGTGSRTLINSNTFTASSSGGLLLTYTNDWKTLTKVQFTTTGALPTGLSLAADYWLVRVSATTANVATSLANAIAGTVIAFTDAGSGTNTLTIQMRYSNGAGCEAFFVSQTQPTAGGPTLSASNYSNTTPTSGRAFQGTPVMNATANAYATRVLHSGNVAGNYGPFLPKQAGDTGISAINSFTWSAGTAYTGTGVVALCIVKPLADISLPITSTWSERDLRNQLPSMPQILDGACLCWMMFNTAATTASAPFTSFVDFGWGP